MALDSTGSLQASALTRLVRGTSPTKPIFITTKTRICKEKQFSNYKHQITNKSQALNPKLQNEMYVPLCLEFELVLKFV